MLSYISDQAESAIAVSPASHQEEDRKGNECLKVKNGAFSSNFVCSQVCIKISLILINFCHYSKIYTVGFAFFLPPSNIPFEDVETSATLWRGTDIFSHLGSIYTLAW